MKRVLAALVLAALTAPPALAGKKPPAPVPAEKPAEPAIRVGYFLNVTHAQALIGRQDGWFEARVPAPIEWKSFNAGPSAMEALLAGALDLAYVGPSPAINVYVRSQGQAVRIVAGAANGGASLIVRTGAGISTPADFRGKKVAAPELGNTQDVALRHWLKANTLAPRAQGGEVDVLAVKNADILALFQTGALDAAWVPEPWATRLIHEGNGELFLDERTLWPDGRFPTVVLVARAAYLREHRDLVRQFVQAHADLTRWIVARPEEAQKLLNKGLEQWLGQPLPTTVLAEAFGRIRVTAELPKDALIASAAQAWELGYLPGDAAPDVSGSLDAVLEEPPAASPSPVPSPVPSPAEAQH